MVEDKEKQGCGKQLESMIPPGDRGRTHPTFLARPCVVSFLECIVETGRTNTHRRTQQYHSNTYCCILAPKICAELRRALIIYFHCGAARTDFSTTQGLVYGALMHDNTCTLHWLIECDGMIRFDHTKVDCVRRSRNTKRRQYLRTMICQHPCVAVHIWKPSVGHT